MKLLFILLAAPFLAAAQTNLSGHAETRGACSPANAGSINKFTFTCGIGEKQGAEILRLLNLIISNEIDPSWVSQIIKQQKEIKNDTSTLLSYGSPTQGEVLPGDSPDPPSSCPSPPEGAYKIILGNSLGYKSKLPALAVRGNGEELLRINSLGRGIGIDALIRGSDGRVMVQMKDNKFVANSNNTLTRKFEPPYTSLEVVDEYGATVLNVNFLNSRTISVLGTFRSGSSVAVIGPDSTIVTIGSRAIPIQGTCIGDVAGSLLGFYDRPTVN